MTTINSLHVDIRDDRSLLGARGLVYFKPHKISMSPLKKSGLDIISYNGRDPRGGCERQYRTSGVNHPRGRWNRTHVRHKSDYHLMPKSYSRTAHTSQPLRIKGWDADSFDIS